MSGDVSMMRTERLGPIVVLTALGEERAAVREHLTDLSPVDHPAGTRFEMGRLPDSGQVVAIGATGRGILAATAVTQQAADTFLPRAMLFCGIAGRLLPSIGLGDVVVGAPVVAFQAGREDPDRFRPEPLTYAPAPMLVQTAMDLMTKDEWLTSLDFPARAVMRPIASGGILLNNRDSATARLLGDYYATAAAIEMEGAGFAEAAAQNGIPAIVIRSISDFADGNKPTTDGLGWRERAARHAAAFTTALVRALPEPEIDPPRRALELALLRAVWQYATTQASLALAVPWLPAHLLQADPRVWAELLKDEPDPATIAGIWREHLAGPVELRGEAELLLGYFRDHARRTVGSDRSVVEARLADARGDLAGIEGLAAAGVADKPMPPAIRIHRYDQTAIIEREQRGFVGREFVYRELDEFFRSQSGGYVCVVADPGVGKTALLAEFVRRTACVHHFNQRTTGIVAPGTFLRNVCAQLITAYGLPDTELPPRAEHDGGYLYELLARAASAAEGRRVFVAVDALDESDRSGLLAGVNPLYLPAELPDGCFVVTTTRPETAELSTQGVLRRMVDPCEKANLDDIRQFIGARVNSPGIEEYRRHHHQTDADFIYHVAAKSEGNFMYLRHLLLDIEQGRFTDIALDGIPAGLVAYYDIQVKRMKGAGGRQWHETQLPVIAAISVALRPLTPAQISDLAEVPLPLVSWALDSFRQFLRPTSVTVDGRTRPAYGIYHTSYKDFLVKYTARTEADLLDRIEDKLLRRTEDEP